MIRKSFLYSLKRTVPILIGFIPVGLAYGILMADAGLNCLWSAGTSVIVLAGSLQMLMISFFKSSMPILTVAVTALLLNSRHIFYGVSFIDKFKSYGKWKWFLIYALADENYSLLCSYQPVEGVDEKWVHIISSALVALYWIIFSFLGGLVGAFIPFDTTGIDFALTALFVVILIDQIKGSPTKLPVIIAAISAVVCLAIFGRDGFLLPSLCITVAGLIVFRPVIEHEGVKK